MSNIKKIIAVALALVLALSAATIAFAVDDSTNPDDAFSISVTAEKTTLNPGESTNVTVKVTANYYVIAMSIPVYFDNTKLTVSNAVTSLERAEVIMPEDAPDDYYQNMGFTRDERGVVVLSYIPKVNQTALSQYDNETVMTFTVTANEGASGAVEVGCLSTVKTSANTGGTIIVGKCATGNKYDSAQSQPQNVTNYNLDNAITTINIAGGAEPADLAVKSAYASSGIIIDKNKTFGGQYDGVVYGFELSGTINAAFYTARLEATNGGSITVVKTPYVARPASYGTGATVQINNADGTLAKTYVIVIFGDVNGDGKVLTTDMTPVLNHSNGAKITDEVLVMAANGSVAKGRTDALKAKSIYDVDATDITPILNAANGTPINQAEVAASHALYNTYYQ